MNAHGTRRKLMGIRMHHLGLNMWLLLHLNMIEYSYSEDIQLLKSDLMIHGSYISNHSHGNVLRVRSQQHLKIKIQ
jgi:hypothetical protein